jgi:DNA-binding transcriptional LysR family regulator
MELNVEHLKTLAEISRDGSFSRAAARRHLSQPAVSHHIRDLERRAGTRLLDRVGKTAVPTEAGRALLVHAARVFDELKQAGETLRLMRGELSGPLRVGTGATASTYLFPAILARFHACHPRVDVRVITGNSQRLAHDVLNNTLDAALVTLPVRGRGLSMTALFADSLVAIAGARTFSRTSAWTPADFRGIPLVLYEPEGSTRRLINDWLGRAPELNVALELGNIEAIKRTVQAGLGVSIVPSLAVRDEIRLRTLRAWPLRPALRRELAVVIRLDRRTHPVIAAFQDAMTAASDGRRKRTGKRAAEA